MLIVQVCDFGNDGDARYRLHDPSRYLSRLPDVTAIDCHFFSRHLNELAELADVLVLQFVNNWDLLTMCERRRAAGRVTVFEANDYFFDLQPWSPIANLWQDRVIQELYLQLLTTADAVQTSTDQLAHQWQRRGAKKVAVFANQLTDVPPLPPPPDRPLTIGWAGSPGHLADWYAIAPALQRWLNAHHDVCLAVMTHDSARGFFQLPPERYSFSSFGSLEDYLRFLTRVDIGLAPLLPTDYNRGRSDVKFLEYASRGVPGIYADLEPYRGSVVAGETGLFFRTTEELLSQLDVLRASRDLRHRIRESGHAYVAERRLLGSHIGRRFDFYKNLLSATQSQQGSGSGTPTPVLRYSEEPDRISKNPALRSTSEPASSGNALPTRILTDAMRDGNYLQIRPNMAEQKLLAITGAAKPAETLAVLNEIVSRHPDYLPALQYQAHVLNDVRDHAAAMRTLDRARQLSPADPHTEMEVGRTLFLQDKAPLALALLQQVVEAHPRYLPAWQYLLRLLGWNKTPAASDWSRRAEALFPACYSIALLGVLTLPSETALEAMAAVLDRYAAELTWAERPLAVAEFRKTIVSVLKSVRSTSAPLPSSALLMLERAAAIFPESPQLAGEFGAALFEAGDIEKACEQQARALSLWRQSAVARSELPQDQTAPLPWYFARHISAATGGQGWRE